jgi:hypothetical protein
MGTLNKVGTIKCSPGVVLTWTGAATSTFLNANGSDHGTLRNGWGMDGCTIYGTGGSGQVLVQLGGANGGHGAVLSNLDLQNAHRGIQTEQHTWSIAVNDSFFQTNDRAVWIESANDSGEGFTFTGNTVADCNNTYGDCFFADVNGSDGLHLYGNTFDDGGIHLKDGNLGALLSGTKWENPNAAATGRYTYGTFDSGGFMIVTIDGGTAMNGAADLTHSPSQIFLNGAQLTINGLALDNNTGGAVTIPALVNNYGGGSVEVLSYKDINVGTVTVGTIATSSITFAIDKGNGLITSYLPFRLYPGGSVPSTAYLGWGEDVGGGATDLFAYDSSAGFFKLMVDANPLVLNGRGGGNVGVGTSSPFAELSVMVGGDYASHAASTIFAFASSTAGRATTTLMTLNSAGVLNVTGNAGFGASVGTPGVAVDIDPTLSSTGAGQNVLHVNHSNAGNAVGDGACISFADNTLGICSFAQSGNKLILKTSSKEQVRFGSNGSVGIGTTTAFAKFSIAANPTDTTIFPILFAIGSSTASATTTLFTVSNIGSTTISLFGSCGSANAVQTNSSGTLICGAVSSDPRLKDNMQPLTGMLGLVTELHPISFNYKPGTGLGTQEEFGFNAKEVQAIFPQAVETMAPTPLTPDGTLEIKEPDLAAVLWQAVLEQQKQIDSFEGVAAPLIVPVERTMEENLQDIAIGVLTILLLGYVSYNEWDKRRRR